MQDNQNDYLPTSPKNRQYNAANIGNGIEAKIAPNFPEIR